MFLSVGPIKSSKIVRDRATGYSYGFGFVDFIKIEDADRAIQTLNGLQLQNKTIKVAFARPTGDDIKGANLYVRNVPKDLKQDEVQDMFGQFGHIIQCRLLTDSYTGASKGVAFVLFEQKQQAEAAMQSLSGKVPENGTEPMTVKFADDNAKKVRAPVMQMMPPGRGGYHQGGGGFGGGPMRHGGNRFNRYNPMTGSYGGQAEEEGDGEGYVLFAYNIGLNATERTLWQLFSPFGVIQKVNVIWDHQRNQCKGFGFVTMNNYHEAMNAINALNGYRFQGRPLQVSFKSPTG